MSAPEGDDRRFALIRLGKLRPPGRTGRRAAEAPLQEGGDAGAAGEPVVLAIAESLRGVATGRAPFSRPVALPTAVRLHSTADRLDLTVERSRLAVVSL